MTNRRRHAARPRNPAPRPTPPSIRTPSAPPDAAPQHPARGSLLPTILWGASTLVFAGLIGGVLIAVMGQQHPPGTRWSLIGTVFLLSVFFLGLALKALQAFLNWKDPDPA